MSEHYPETLEIQPITGPVTASVSVPGSKSITNRALVLAALAKAKDGCRLHGALRSEDTEVMIDCLRKLGFRLEVDWEHSEISVGSPSHRLIPEASADLFAANSGTSMRFLCAMVSLGKGRYRLDGVSRMRERPIEDLLAALRQLGVDARSETGNGCPPVTIDAKGIAGGSVAIRGDVSSQFLSALMMIAPFTTEGLTIRLAGSLVSEPYIVMTRKMLESWGATVEQPTADSYKISPGLDGEREQYAIEPDASAASYFLAAAAILQGQVTVLDLPEQSLQGDVDFVDILGQMGCRIEKCSSGITVHGRPLRGVEVDMNAISDTVMTLGAVACFADGPTTIRNVGHIRHKETDRITALANELRKVGASVEEFADGLKITPGPLRGAIIDTYNDHRMAMSMALVGLRVPGVVIRNPGCVAKTYPDFWRDLAKLK
ncbi:MAG: 3-phosphoshikimate 1-carboxyvinyltransferase [Planctomycetes bacterium]|nr:3-phosphoshikimate 1-carboxyvinyltransferase [Planctomycetota bacterium]